MDKRKSEVLVKEISKELAHAYVGPAAMHQQEALKVTELGKGKVAGQHCLHAFLPTDTYTNMSS